MHCLWLDGGWQWKYFRHPELTSYGNTAWLPMCWGWEVGPDNIIWEYSMAVTVLRLGRGIGRHHMRITAWLSLCWGWEGGPDNLDSSLDCEYVRSSLGSAVLLCKMSAESHLLPGLSVTTQYSIGKLRLRHIWQCGVGWYSGLRWREGLGEAQLSFQEGQSSWGNPPPLT